MRAMSDETVTISGADLIQGWQREGGGSWSVRLEAEPKKVLRDGQPWNEFHYDSIGQRITVIAGGDLRLHVFETVVREQAIDLAGKKDCKIEGSGSLTHWRQTRRISDTIHECVDFCATLYFDVLA